MAKYLLLSTLRSFLLRLDPHAIGLPAREHRKKYDQQQKKSVSNYVTEMRMLEHELQGTSIQPSDGDVICHLIAGSQY